MTSSPLNLTGTFDDFIPKAFIIALVRSEKVLPSELILEINQVGEALRNGQRESLSSLLAIAKKDGEFYAVFKQAYKELQQIDNSEEKNKYLTEVMKDPPPRKLDDFDNFLAPPLTSKDPQSQAKSLFAKVGDLVQKIYQLNF